MIRALSTAFLAVSVLAAPAAFAGEVYQWKDAGGVTHYSQTPPSQGKFQQRTITQRENTAPTQSPERPVSPQCATAQRNIELLQGGSRLQVDSNGDGQPDGDLDDADRQKQLEIAQTVARVNCAER